MAKGKSGSGDRSAKVAKAGKRSGNTVYPLPLSSDRRAGKEQGEQQFVSQKPLTVEQEVTKIVFDSKLGQFVYRTKKEVVSAEHVFDPSRGRVIFNPYFKEKTPK